MESFLFPSKVLSKPWLSLSAPGAAPFHSTERTGKYLIYRQPTRVDAAWIKVAATVSTGMVVCAKVSTRQGLLLGYEQHVICAYALAWDDRNEA